MAVTIINKAEDQSSQMSNNKITLERLMRVEADNVLEIATSSVIPQYGSRHPNNSAFQVSEVNVEPIGNIGRKVQAAVRITYTNDSGGSGGGSDGGKNVDPWELGAQNVSEDYTTEREPLTCGFDEKGEEIQLRNSAGSRLQIESDVIIRQISFTYAVKAGRSGEPPINHSALINKQIENVAGYVFKPYQAMLMPMRANFTADVDDSGKVYRRYWTISAVILEHPKTWKRSALDVGTMALFDRSEEFVDLALQPIYQYTPWEDKEDENNLKTQPIYGSIDDVVRAKNKYAALFDKTEYASRWDALPYSEITEPLPLLSGKVYEDAMLDPENNPYQTIDYFESNPVSWQQWNLPKKRA